MTLCPLRPYARYLTDALALGIAVAVTDYITHAFTPADGPLGERIIAWVVLGILWGFIAALIPGTWSALKKLFTRKGKTTTIPTGEDTTA